MATSNAALPPMAQISMIGIWVETVLYGMSCVVSTAYLPLILACLEVSSKPEWLYRTLRLLLIDL